MLNYLIRRVLIGLLTLWLITFVVYGLIRNMPGDPMTTDMSESDPSKKTSKEDRERLEKIYRLDMHWSLAYVYWMGDLVRFDLGPSFSQKEPVLNVVAEHVGPTLLLSITSMILVYIMAVPMGLTATARSGKLDERIMSVTLFMLYSLPAFVAGLQLMTLFHGKLSGTWAELPLFGMTTSGAYATYSPLGKLWDVVQHMILPVTCLTYGVLAYDSRFIKSNMEEVVRQDYIRTARAKGVGPFRVLAWHAFRNTLIPFVTLLGLSLPALFSGAVILERLFSWPGMGQLFFEAISSRDYPLIMGLTLMFTTLTLLGQLVADVMYAFVDPRVTYN